MSAKPRGGLAATCHLAPGSYRARWFNPRDGRFLERIGTYDPHGETVVVNEARISYWQGVGAHPTTTVARLLRKARKATAVAAKA